MRSITALLLLTGFGCSANRPMRPEHASAQLSRLPGGDLPVREVCRVQSRAASQQLPIQVRDELGQSATATAFAECIEVLTVLVSVAMISGDNTGDGLEAVQARIAGVDGQVLADSCDEHYRAWQLLQLRDERFRRVSPGGEIDNLRYDGWMDRCFRVLRPWSRAPEP